MNRLALLVIALLTSLTSIATPTDTVVSIVTAYPGTDIYELEGHSAIRIDMGPDGDYAVSYGMFDFNAPNFVYRFVKGETDYMVGIVPFARFVDEYRSQGRRIEELVLDLTPEQKRRLIGLLDENLRPENRVYRYNYVKDNCSTRPRRMIELAVGDTIPTAWRPEGTQSFRDVMRSYHRNYPWYQFGIDLALGSGIDYPLSTREYGFVPMLMAGQLEQSPVAADKRVLADFAPDNAVEGPTPWFATPIAVCWAVFALVALTVLCDLRRGRPTRWVYTAFFGILGLAGLLIAFLIFVSVHEATSPNWLFIWLNPLCLIPAIFVWWRRARRLVWWYSVADFVVVGVALIAWPFLPQSANPAFLPLVLATLGLLGSYAWIYRNRP